jgi:hypothetical protein
MWAQSKKGRVPLSSKERHLNANTVLNRTTDALASARHTQQAALRMINEGNVRRAQHFLNVVKDTIDTSMCTVAIANSNINSEQSSTAAKATRAIAVADQRHLKKQNNGVNYRFTSK